MQPATAVKNSPAEAPVHFWSWLERHEGRLATLMVLLYVVVFGSLALVRHWAFHSTALDLGVFDQVLIAAKVRVVEACTGSTHVAPST